MACFPSVASYVCVSSDTEPGQTDEFVDIVPSPVDIWFNDLLSDMQMMMQTVDDRVKELLPRDGRVRDSVLEAFVNALNGVQQRVDEESMVNHTTTAMEEPLDISVPVLQELPCSSLPPPSVDLPTDSAPEKQERKSRPEGRVSCDICGKFLAVGSLPKHKAAHNKTSIRQSVAQDRVQCDLCGKMLKPRCIKPHLLTHNEESQFSCPICPATFRQQSSVKPHILTHGGERPHKCTICGAAFKLRKVLNLHTRTHTGDKRYVCKICPARFITSSQLVRHTQHHEGVRPYRCEFCSSAFTQPNDLRKHRSVHAKMDPRLAKRVKILNASRTKKSELKQPTQSTQQQKLEHDSSDQSVFS